MNKTTMGVIGATLVIVIGASTFAFYQNKNSNDASTPQISSVVQVDTSSPEYKQFSAMTGEMFDRNFIANMIAHHQGAVDMAKLAQTNAKRVELKTMANEIIAAQEKEIADMLSWQKAWGYPSTSADNMVDHSAMGMMDDMAGMTVALEGKTGDEFDKVFLEQMILHHQSALNMAAPGRNNAQHQELKDLSVAIVEAQTKETQKMKQWQKDWGYQN